MKGAVGAETPLARPLFALSPLAPSGLDAFPNATGKAEARAENPLTKLRMTVEK